MAELKVVKTELKDKYHHIEMLKIEATRWQEEANELMLKCRTYEAQLEQKQTEFKQILLQKDVKYNYFFFLLVYQKIFLYILINLLTYKAQIAEMQKQHSLTMVSTSSSLIDAGHFQKSALMEEFEEIVPQSEYSDFINLQKELRRITDDNIHLTNENRQLLNRIKNFEQINSTTESTLSSSSTDNLKELEMTIQSLRKEIFVSYVFFFFFFPSEKNYNLC